MNRVHAIAEYIARMGAYGGCTLLVLASALVSFEVVIRKVFSVSLTGADELAGYALGISMAWGYAHCLFRRGHIRVDAVYLKLPLWMRSVLDVVALIAFAGMIAMLCGQGIGVLQETLRLDAKSSTPLATPLVIPQTLWLAGLLFFLFCLILLAVRATGALLRGDLLGVNALAGAPSAQEEIDAELEEIVERRGADEGGEEGG